jgi:hypothetical protein
MEESKTFNLWSLLAVIVAVFSLISPGALQSAPAADEAKSQFADLKKKVPAIVEDFLKSPDGLGGDSNRTTTNGVTTQSAIEWKATIRRIQRTSANEAKISIFLSSSQGEGVVATIWLSCFDESWTTTRADVACSNRMSLARKTLIEFEVRKLMLEIDDYSGK